MTEALQEEDGNEDVMETKAASKGKRKARIQNLSENEINGWVDGEEDGGRNKAKGLAQTLCHGTKDFTLT